MFTYNLLREVQFIKINSININSASIMYSVSLLDNDNKEELVNRLNSKAGSLIIYGKHYIPHIYLNGDLLCITINK